MRGVLFARRERCFNAPPSSCRHATMCIFGGHKARRKTDREPWARKAFVKLRPWLVEGFSQHHDPATVSQPHLHRPDLDSVRASTHIVSVLAWIGVLGSVMWSVLTDTRTSVPTTAACVTATAGTAVATMVGAGGGLFVASMMVVLPNEAGDAFTKKFSQPGTIHYTAGWWGKRGLRRLCLVAGCLVVAAPLGMFLGVLVAYVWLSCDVTSLEHMVCLFGCWHRVCWCGVRRAT